MKYIKKNEILKAESVLENELLQRVVELNALKKATAEEISEKEALQKEFLIRRIEWLLKNA